MQILNSCVMCAETIDAASQIFEQRLIGDSDFCPRCFREIMDAEYDSDLDNLYAGLLT